MQKAKRTQRSVWLLVLLRMIGARRLRVRLQGKQYRRCRAERRLAQALKSRGLRSPHPSAFADTFPSRGRLAQRLFLTVVENSDRCLNFINSVTLGNGVDRAVVVIFKLSNTNTAVEQASAGELCGMIEQERMTLKVTNSGVVGEGPAFFGHNNSAVGPRACGRG